MIFFNKKDCLHRQLRQANASVYAGFNQRAIAAVFYYRQILYCKC